MAGGKSASWSELRWWPVGYAFEPWAGARWKGAERQHAAAKTGAEFLAPSTQSRRIGAQEAHCDKTMSFDHTTQSSTT